MDSQIAKRAFSTAVARYLKRNPPSYVILKPTTAPSQALLIVTAAISMLPY